MIFSPDPKITDADVKRLLPVLENKTTGFTVWLATEPPLVDLKKALLIEVEKTRMKYKPLEVMETRGVVRRLLRRISDIETEKLESKIKQLCNSK